MTAAADAAEEQRPFQFFISYAHTPPTGADLREDPDRYVGDFHRELSEAVAVLSRHRGLPVGRGFIDRSLAAGSNWGRYRAAALTTCQVLVPLYAPRYFGNTVVGREWTSFRLRLEQSGVADVEDRFIPVLWNPLPPERLLPPRAPAPRIAIDEIPEYREHGLQVLRKLPRFRGPYDSVVAALAEAVVTRVAERPIAPGPVPDLDDADLDFPHGQYLQSFVIAVFAGSAKQQPERSPAGYYGESVADWRPFGPQETLPLSRYASEIAERYGYAAIVADPEKAGPLLATAPGIALLDPWHPGLTEDGPSALAALPAWTLPVVVFSSHDPRLAGDGAAAVERFTGALAAGHPARTEAARHATGGICDLADFRDLFPILVTDAARRYLRLEPVYPPRGAAGTPR